MVINFLNKKQFLYKTVNQGESKFQVPQRHYSNLVDNISYIAPIIFLTGYGIYSAFKYIFKPKIYKTQATQTEADAFSPTSDGNNLLVTKPLSNTSETAILQNWKDILSHQEDKLVYYRNKYLYASEEVNNLNNALQRLKKDIIKTGQEISTESYEDIYTSIFEQIDTSSLPMGFCLTLYISLILWVKTSCQLLMSYMSMLKHSIFK